MTKTHGDAESPAYHTHARGYVNGSSFWLDDQLAILALMLRYLSTAAGSEEWWDILTFKRESHLSEISFTNYLFVALLFNLWLRFYNQMTWQSNQLSEKILCIKRRPRTYKDCRQEFIVSNLSIYIYISVFQCCKSCF